MPFEHPDQSVGVIWFLFVMAACIFGFMWIRAWISSRRIRSYESQLEEMVQDRQAYAASLKWWAELDSEETFTYVSWWVVNLQMQDDHYLPDLIDGCYVVWLGHDGIILSQQHPVEFMPIHIEGAENLLLERMKRLFISKNWSRTPVDIAILAGPFDTVQEAEIYKLENFER